MPKRLSTRDNSVGFSDNGSQLHDDAGLQGMAVDKKLEEWWNPSEGIVDVLYVVLQAHGIVNVALHREYSPRIIFIFSQGRKDLYHV
jgi:hypothetical protein